jgi:transposase
VKMREVVLRAVAGKITWNQAADVLGMSHPNMERLRQLYIRRGYDGLWVRASRNPHSKLVPFETLEMVLQLYQRRYSSFSIRSFRDRLREKHGIDLSYKWIEQALQESGLVAKISRGESGGNRQS